ncbi:MAG: protein kinase [Blautia sp.]
MPDERYAFERVLGEGAQGKVYLAYDRKLKKHWAVKELKVSSEEAKIMLELDHPGLPRITDVMEKDNHQYIVMDFMEGKTLKEMKEEMEKKQKYFSWKQRITWGIQICSLLEYLHSPGKEIIHQDLKPSNLLVHISGNIRILDFGIASREGRESSGMGTPGYAAPEQRKRKAEKRSDIYALGAVLLYMERKGEKQTYLYGEWKKVIRKCMEENPEKRYRNISLLKKDLIRLERIRQGKKRVYAGTVLGVMGILFLLSDIKKNIEVKQTNPNDSAEAFFETQPEEELTDPADYEEAKTYFLQNQIGGENQEAYSKLLNALEYPQNADWKKIRGILEELRQQKKESWIEARENVFLADIYLAYGNEMEFTAEEKAKEAATLLERAKEQLQENPEEPLAFLYEWEADKQLARCYEISGDTDKGIACYLRILEHENNVVQRKMSMLALLYLYRKKGEYEKAEEGYQSLLEEDPLNQEAACAYALMEALERNNPEKGAEILKQTEERLEQQSEIEKSKNMKKAERKIREYRENFEKQ